MPGADSGHDSGIGNGSQTRLRRTLAAGLLGIVAALVVLVPAASSAGSAAAAEGRLGVSSLRLGDVSIAAITLSSDPAARVTLVVPQGYELQLGQPAGTSIGFVSALLAETAGTSSSAFASGELVADDPAKYVSDPDAQACAPGAHAAVWSTTLSVLGQTFNLPVFVDPGGVSDAGPGAATLRFCPAWRSPASASTVTAPGLSLFVEGAIVAPTAQGRYTWSALVAPLDGSSPAPNEAGVFELRSVVPNPHVLTLRARHDAKKRSVVLSGTLTAVGEPEAGVEVSFGASTDSFSDVSFFGPVRTNAAGAFSVRRHIEQTTQFSVSADAIQRACATPSSAPAGCVSETVSAPLDASVLVRVRRATDPKLVPRARDQALARRITLKLRDFPPGWEAFDTFPVFACPGFRPRLKDLTVSGEHESPAFASDVGVVSSRASVYVAAPDARKAFAREAKLQAARCLADQIRDAGYTILQLQRVPFPPLGDESRAFRVVASFREEIFTVDLVSFRQGRAVVHLGFGSLVQPLLIARDLANVVAARARGA